MQIMHIVFKNFAINRGQFTMILQKCPLISGCPVGTILTMPLTGLLTKYGFDGGWASVFYVFGEFQCFLV